MSKSFKKRFKDMTGVYQASEYSFYYKYTKKGKIKSQYGFRSREEAHAARLKAIKADGLEIDENEKIITRTHRTQSEKEHFTEYQNISRGKYRDGREYFWAWGTTSDGQHKRRARFDTLEEAIEARKKFEESGKVNTKITPQTLRKAYDDTRINGVVMPLFKGKKPRSDSKIGFRGVWYNKAGDKYYGKIQVKGKMYYSHPFDTAEDAYYYGRLRLEAEHLPTVDNKKKNAPSNEKKKDKD